MEKMLGEYGRRRLYSGLGPMGTPTTTAAVCVGEEAESLTYTVEWRGCVGGAMEVCLVVVGIEEDAAVVG